MTNLYKYSAEMKKQGEKLSPCSTDRQMLCGSFPLGVVAFLGAALPFAFAAGIADWRALVSVVPLIWSNGTVGAKVGRLCART